MKLDELVAALREHYPFRPPRPLGLGKRPALLIVDFIEGFTSNESPLGGPWDEQVGHTATLLACARSSRVPVVFTTVEYQPSDVSSNLLARKTPGIGVLLKGSRWTAIDHRLATAPEDLVVSKKFGSAFFGTTLASQLQVLGIDSVLVSGCVTSGCIRATAVDAVQSGYPAAVVRETVGDRSPLANETNLIDIEQRYGDVISLAEAMQHFRSLEG